MTISAVLRSLVTEVQLEAIEEASLEESAIEAAVAILVREGHLSPDEVKPMPGLVEAMEARRAAQSENDAETRQD